MSNTVETNRYQVLSLNLTRYIMKENCDIIINVRNSTTLVQFMGNIGNFRRVLNVSGVYIVDTNKQKYLWLIIKSLDMICEDS